MSKTHALKGWYAMALLLSILCVFSLSSSAQDPRGTLRGIVQDATGARVAAAKVTVHAGEPPLERQAATNSRGEFRIDELLPGAYAVVVRAQGFAEATSNVRIAVSTTTDITVALKPATV